MISLTKKNSKNQTVVVTLENMVSIVTVDGIEICRGADAAKYSPLPVGYTHLLGGKLVLTTAEAEQHNVAYTAHCKAILAAEAAHPKTLAEQREALALEVYNTNTDAFPGSAEWLRYNAAENALADFDAAHAQTINAASVKAPAKPETIVQFKQKGSDRYLKCSVCERFTHADNNTVMIQHKSSCTEPTAQPTQEQIQALRTFKTPYSYYSTLYGTVTLFKGEYESLRASGHSMRDIIDGNHDH